MAARWSANSHHSSRPVMWPKYVLMIFSQCSLWFCMNFPLRFFFSRDQQHSCFLVLESWIVMGCTRHLLPHAGGPLACLKQVYFRRKRAVKVQTSMSCLGPIRISSWQIQNELVPQCLEELGAGRSQSLLRREDRKGWLLLPGASRYGFLIF